MTHGALLDAFIALFDILLFSSMFVFINENIDYLDPYNGFCFSLGF